MNIQLECIPCSINSYLRLVKTGVIPEALQEPMLRRLLRLLSTIEYNQSPPIIGRKMHRLIREFLQNPDPYHQIKEYYNRMMLELYTDFENLVKESENPIDTAMRLAIAGNVIDFGSKYQLDVMDTINRVKGAKLAIDDSRHLRHDLNQATSLLYIGDNCGEIVLDKLFLETIDLPEMYFVVRDRPVINDVTIHDAEMTGLTKIAKVITTGDDAPGAVWEATSKEFKDIFTNADVIISKGQGNLEGLIDIPHNNIFFLLVTKCDLIAERVGARKGEFIVKKG
ncbi:ARMT1-like domain-containing protein [Draconibacterium sp.]|nr:ARMT1-like domain-containing protein [Draconibacterium sp.]